MTHVELADEWRKLSFHRLFVLLFAHGIEDFRYRCCPGGTLTKHIFVARFGAQSDASQSGAFLSSVVLFLHE